MGVPGLFDALKPISRPISITELKGLVVGIDGYGWLHKATFSCATELLQGKPTTRYLEYFEKRINLLESQGIALYFVFDGDDLPIKQRVNASRAKTRRSAKANLGANPSMVAAKQALDITPEMAAAVCALLKTRNIPFVVAPFEADAQLVYLESQGIIDAIISEDSDMFVFGCKKLVAKFKDTTAVLVDFNRLTEIPLFKSFRSLELVRALAILSGCDYSAGINGVGIIKAAQILTRTGSLDAAMAQLSASAEFVAQAAQAQICFQHQRVWDPREKQLTLLTEPSDPDLELSDEIIGHTRHTFRKAMAAQCASTDKALILHPTISFYVSKSRRPGKVLSPHSKQPQYRQRVSKLFNSPAPASASPFFAARTSTKPTLITAATTAVTPLTKSLIEPPTPALTGKENIPPQQSVTNSIPVPATKASSTPTPATRVSSMPSPDSSPAGSPTRASSSKSIDDRVLFRTFSQSFSGRTEDSAAKRPTPAKLDFSQFAYTKR